MPRVSRTRSRTRSRISNRSHEGASFHDCWSRMMMMPLGSVPDSFQSRRRRVHPYEGCFCFPIESPHSHRSRRRGSSRQGLHVCLYAAHFRPSELSVKVISKTIIVEGKHAARSHGDGFIQRHIVRKYALPKGCDPGSVVATISIDGVLSLLVPPPPPKNLEHIIAIRPTGTHHLVDMVPPSDDDDDNNMRR